MLLRSGSGRHCPMMSHSSSIGEKYGDLADQVAFSQRNSSTSLIGDGTFSDSDIINNFIDYEDGHEELDSLR
ncbi:hypothetical protein TNCV_2592231 [Trichonephila clavipes]|nr:hypothetical protein TNCV_2592231 [Trichonephila clavipes]